MEFIATFPNATIRLTSPPSTLSPPRDKNDAMTEKVERSQTYLGV